MDLEDNQEVDPLDDSFGDENYELNKETVEDEDEDDIEQKYAFCSYQMFWDDQMKHHREWKHSTLLKLAKKSKKRKAPNEKGLETGKICDTCGKTFGQRWNLKRHVEKMHGL